MLVADVHRRRLARSAEIAKFQLEVQMERRFLSPLDVIRVLNREKISFVLAGAYGLAGWRTQARATEGVDIIVAAKQVKKATKLLLAEFKFLEADDQEVVIRLRDKTTKDVLVDVMKPTQEHIKAVFKHTKTVELAKQTYRIPSCEMALAMKFAPMVNLVREDQKKLIDAADFIDIVQNNQNLDEEVLRSLGEMIYPGGGKKLVGKVNDVKAGKKLRV